MRLLVQLSVLRDRGNFHCHSNINISDINNGTNYFKYLIKLIFMAILVTVTSSLSLGFPPSLPFFLLFPPFAYNHSSTAVSSFLLNHFRSSSLSFTVLHPALVLSALLNQLLSCTLLPYLSLLLTLSYSLSSLSLSHSLSL